MYAEVSVLLCYYSSVLIRSIRSNLIIYRTCYVVLGYNQSECVLLGSQHQDNLTSYLEEKVQPYASMVILTLSLTEALTAAVSCLFVAPWSDRFGRKLPLIVSTAGTLLSYLLTTIFTSWENLTPWYLLLCFVPMFFTGGIFTFAAAVLCWVTDTTTVHNRGLRMSRVDGGLFLGIFLGAVSGSYLLEATNYVTVFTVATICTLVNLVIVTACLPESLSNPEHEGRLKALFQYDHIVDILRTAFKRRQNYDRFVVLCCIFMFTLVMITINGDGAVKQFFLREKFQWSLRQYTLFEAAESITGVIGTVVGVFVFHKLFRLSEYSVVPIGLCSYLLSSVMMGAAQDEKAVWATPLFRVLAGCVSPMLRSLVFKVVPTEESGKIYAFVGALEALVGTVSALLIYTAIYNATITTNPGAYNLVSAGIIGLDIVCAIVMVIVQMRPEIINRFFGRFLHRRLQNSYFD